MLDFVRFIAEGRLMIFECKNCEGRQVFCTGKHYRHSSNVIKGFLERKFEEFKKKGGTHAGDNIRDK